MNMDSGMTFEHCFSSDSVYSYLVLKLESNVILLNHQAEIICQNPNPAFVPFHIRRNNEDTSIYYNITSRISLSQFLERKRLTKKELLDLLKNITKNLILHSNYLLDLSGYIVDPDFIYINPASAEVSMVYIPASFQRNTMEIYIEFLKDLVVNSASIDDSSGDNYLHRILNYLKSDVFNLNDFRGLIADLRNSDAYYETTSRSACEYEDKEIKKESMASNSITDGSFSKKEVRAKTAERKNAVRIILLQLLFITAAAIACLLLLSKGAGDMMSIGGALLIAAALDILSVKSLTGRQDKKPAGTGEKINSSNHQYLQKRKAKKKADFHGMDKKPERRLTAPVPDVINAYDTIILSDVSKDCNPYLESIETDRFERVAINKDKFVIGRLGSMVDHIVQGNTVGKLHAEITKNGGLYYIKDLNSKNGTFINGVRIPSNKDCEIMTNDRIRFSDFEYIFKRQEVL